MVQWYNNPVHWVSLMQGVTEANHRYNISPADITINENVLSLLFK